MKLLCLPCRGVQKCRRAFPAEFPHAVSITINNERTQINNRTTTWTTRCSDDDDDVDVDDNDDDDDDEVLPGTSANELASSCAAGWCVFDKQRVFDSRAADQKPFFDEF